jgi:hypothetical protein
LSHILLKNQSANFVFFIPEIITLPLVDDPCGASAMGLSLSDFIGLRASFRFGFSHPVHGTGLAKIMNRHADQAPQRAGKTTSSPSPGKDRLEYPKDCRPLADSFLGGEAVDQGTWAEKAPWGIDPRAWQHPFN